MKVIHKGSSKTRNSEWFEVGTILIEAVYLGSALGENIYEYYCTCKDCTVKRIPNDLPPRCVFTKELEKYLKHKKVNKIK